MSRWHCRICRTYGLGGPDGAVTHLKSEHPAGQRLGAAMSFGFSPNYANGSERRWDRIWSPAVAQTQEQP
jgi:hypothetical protein